MPRGITLFLPSSHQAKSYYLTIDRAPSIQLFGTGNTSSYQNTSVEGDLFSHQRHPDLGKLDFFRIYHPSPTRGRVLQEVAWVWCMGLLRYVAEKLDFIKRPGRTRGRLSTWKFECDELCREVIAPVDVYIEAETGKLFAFDLALERVALRRRGTRATEARRKDRSGKVCFKKLEKRDRNNATVVACDKNPFSLAACFLLPRRIWVYHHFSFTRM